jgi:DNA-binding SARP family transcriptional activator
MLGRFMVRRTNGEWTALAGGLSGDLLCYVALHAPRPVLREEAAEALWAEVDPERSRQRLRRVLHELRSDLAGAGIDADTVLCADRATIGLCPEAVTDVSVFERLTAAAAKSPDSVEEIERLSAAMEIYQGPMLPACDLPSAAEQRNRLAMMFADVALRLTLALEAGKRYPEALEAGRRAVQADPLSEEAHCSLMRIYAALHQPSAVNRQFEEMRAAFHHELGEPPSAAAFGLLERLLRQAHQNGHASPETHHIEPKPVPSPQASQENPNVPVRPLPVTKILFVTAVCFACITMFLLAGGRRGGSILSAGSAALPQHRVLRSTGLRPPQRQADWVWEMPHEIGMRDAEPVAVAASGHHIYLTGFEQTDHEDVNIVLLCLSQEGRMLWKRSIDGTAHDVDRPTSVAADASGVTILGETCSTQENGTTRLSGLDILLARFDPEGKLMWKQTLDGGEHGEDRPVGMVTLADGGQVVCWRSFLRSTDGMGVQPHLQLARLAPGDGTVIWRTAVPQWHGIRNNPLQFARFDENRLAAAVDVAGTHGRKDTLQTVLFHLSTGTLTTAAAAVESAQVDPGTVRFVRSADDITRWVVWADAGGADPAATQIHVRVLDSYGRAAEAPSFPSPYGRGETVTEAFSSEQVPLLLLGGTRAPSGNNDFLVCRGVMMNNRLQWTVAAPFRGPVDVEDCVMTGAFDPQTADLLIAGRSWFLPPPGQQNNTMVQCLKPDLSGVRWAAEIDVAQRGGDDIPKASVFSGSRFVVAIHTRGPLYPSIAVAAFKR